MPIKEHGMVFQAAKASGERWDSATSRLQIGQAVWSLPALQGLGPSGHEDGWDVSWTRIIVERLHKENLPLF